LIGRVVSCKLLARIEPGEKTMKKRSVLPPAAICLAALSAFPAAAQPQEDFPQNGTYYADCAPGGEGAPGAERLTLSFPEVCFDGACCDLSNPTRLRLMPDQFLYDGVCEENGEAFEARVFFGRGTGPDTVVIVLRGLGMTLERCEAAPEPEPEPDDA
jgi:hypothetical protein